MGTDAQECTRTCFFTFNQQVTTKIAVESWFCAMLGGFNVCSQIGASLPLHILELEYRENSNQREVTGQFDALIDALGLEETTSGQLLAMLISRQNYDYSYDRYCGYADMVQQYEWLNAEEKDGIASCAPTFACAREYLFKTYDEIDEIELQRIEDFQKIEAEQLLVKGECLRRMKDFSEKSDTEPIQVVWQPTFGAKSGGGASGQTYVFGQPADQPQPPVLPTKTTSAPTAALTFDFGAPAEGSGFIFKI